MEGGKIHGARIGLHEVARNPRRNATILSHISAIALAPETGYDLVVTNSSHKRR
jgi:hypothetical protein